MNIAARATWAPGRGSVHGKRVQPVRDRHLEQLVPRRVELDLVDPVPVAVVGPQHRRVLVRLPAPLERLAAGDLAERAGALGAQSAPSRSSASTSGRSCSKTL